MSKQKKNFLPFWQILWIYLLFSCDRRLSFTSRSLPNLIIIPDIFLRMLSMSSTDCLVNYFLFSTQLHMALGLFFFSFIHIVQKCVFSFSFAFPSQDLLILLFLLQMLHSYHFFIISFVVSIPRLLLFLCAYIGGVLKSSLHDQLQRISFIILFWWS